MKLSIIVPMYNVEKYLRQCLDSIYKLDKIEKEVILVNDGSKDGTLNIAKKYGEKYKEITTVIDQPNSGGSIEIIFRKRRYGYTLRKQNTLF